VFVRISRSRFTDTITVHARHLDFKDVIGFGWIFWRDAPANRDVKNLIQKSAAG
jgi:hypothetical protein